MGQDNLWFLVIYTYSEYEMPINLHFYIVMFICNVMLVNISNMTNYNMSMTITMLCLLPKNTHFLNLKPNSITKDWTEYRN